MLLIVNTRHQSRFHPTVRRPGEDGRRLVFYPDKMEVTSKTIDYDALVKILQGRPRPNPARHHIPRGSGWAKPTEPAILRDKRTPS